MTGASSGIGKELIDLEEDLHVIELDVTSTVRVAKHDAVEMARRGQGRLLLTSPITALMPGPTDTDFFRRAPRALGAGRPSERPQPDEPPEPNRSVSRPCRRLRSLTTRAG